MSTAVILGAGFSFSAGLPLTQNLIPLGESAVELIKREGDKAVFAAYAAWHEANPSRGVEEWLAALYELRHHRRQASLQGTTWSAAIRSTLRRLVDLPDGRNTPYYFGITTYRCHPVHEHFWNRVESEFRPRVIVSMNYDLLVEQALHRDRSEHRSSPRCYYGGFMHTQVVRKMTDVVKKQFDIVPLGNEFALYKLHGSVNWAWEKHSPTLKVHDDVRAIFRTDDRIGEPAIVPPIPEKSMPVEFAQVWTEARKALISCQHWLVCGYSMPTYDLALKEFFAGILADGQKRRITILAPDSAELACRWRAIGPKTLSLLSLPGIPDALANDWQSES